MTIRVVHLSKTPLAGSPIRIVAALNRHTDVEARLVVSQPGHYGARAFDGDLSWQEDREEAEQVIAEADIIHIHRYMDLRAKPFGLDFDELRKSGKALIRQFHANPAVIAKGQRQRIREIVEDPIPQLVIAQFHERFYPRARVVPNIVPVNAPAYVPIEKPESPVRIFFAPTFPCSAWESRWETKGFPETRKLLRKLTRAVPGVTADIAQELPHRECLARRQRSHVSIDEMATGSYHMSSLESLAQGVPTVAYLDTRMQETLRALTGASELPWLNLRVEEAYESIVQVLRDRTVRNEIGRRARKWMLEYWDEAVMVQHYVGAYTDLLEHPDRFEKQRFDESDRAIMWHVTGVDDAVWKARRRSHAPWGMRWMKIRNPLRPGRRKAS